MLTKFVYKNKKTGKKVYSEKPLKDEDLVLITRYSDARIKSSEVMKK